jgi:hypothetical protein
MVHIMSLAPAQLLFAHPIAGKSDHDVISGANLIAYLKETKAWGLAVKSLNIFGVSGAVTNWSSSSIHVASLKNK